MNTCQLPIGLAGVDAIVGELGGHARRILEPMEPVEELGAHVAAFPQLAITGYVQ